MTRDVSYRRFSGTAAENYERYFVPAIGRPVSTPLLEAADLRPGERVLDAACGTGIIARLAAEAVGPTGAVTGVDVAPEMLDVARTTSGPDAIHVDWREGALESLPLADDSFDAVLSQLGLMFVDDKAAALAEMHRVLAAGGRLALSTAGRIQRPLEILDEALVRHVSSDLAGFVRVVFSMHDPDELANLLRDAGFGEVAATTTTVTLRVPPPADFLWQYINLTPLGAFVSQAPEDAQLALERDVVERWQEFVEDGSVVTHQPMVIATARA